jgi:hypothetical protein
MFKGSTPETIELSTDEIIVLFTTHPRVEEGFAGMTLGERTWATYLKPPYLYTVLLSAEEQTASFEKPMQQVIGGNSSANGTTQEELADLYQQIVEHTSEQRRLELIAMPAVKKLLETLDTSPEALVPVWSAGAGYRHPVVEQVTGLPSSEATKLLDSMNMTGLLQARIWGNLATCPHGGSHRLVVQAICPRCSSSDIEAGTTLKHLVCNHTDFIDAFAVPGGLACPQCRQSMMLGSYRALGPQYRCVRCHAFRGRPALRLVCLECKGVFPPDDAAFKSIYYHTSRREP